MPEGDDQPSPVRATARVGTLVPKEQRYSYMAAGFAAVASVALWAPSFDETAAVVLAAIGVTMAALLAAAAWRRSRVLTGAAAVLLSFGPWGMAWLIGLPFLGLAAWLTVRAPRRQPRERLEQVEPAGRPRRGRRGNRRQADEQQDVMRRPARRTGPPAANKRYTPPQRRS